MAISAAVALFGVVLVALPSSLLGVIGFLVLIAAVPVLPMLGVPAVSSSSAYILVIWFSASLWLAIGHSGGLRANKRDVSGGPEWLREVRPFEIGVWVGAILSHEISAVVLGAL